MRKNELTFAQFWAKVDKDGDNFKGPTPCFLRYSLWAFKQSNWNCSLLWTVDVGTVLDCGCMRLSSFRHVTTFGDCLILSCSKREVVSNTLGSIDVLNCVEDDCELNVVFDVITVRVTVEEDDDPWTVLVVTLLCSLLKNYFDYYVLIHNIHTNRLNIFRSYMSHKAVCYLKSTQSLLLLFSVRNSKFK